MTEFKFPDVGEGISEGDIVKWHVKIGDKVKEDDTLVEMETAKAIVQIPSPQSGKISDIRGKVGDTVNVGDVLVVFEGGTSSKPNVQAAAPKKLKSSQGIKSGGVVGELKEAKGDLGGVNALPAVRMLAKKSGINLSSLKGSGTDGRITIGDVKNAAGINASGINSVRINAGGINSAGIIKQSKSDTSSKPSQRQQKRIESLGKAGTRIPIKGVRKAIADNMVKSIFTIPHVTHMDEADITHLVEIRTREKEFAARKGVKLTYMPFIIRAILAGLKDHPMLNSSIEGNDIVLKDFYNIGIAVDTKHGLIVPNIKNADKKKLLVIAREIFELADKTRDRSIGLESLQNGTFTITNYGAFGGTHATPIINPPEVGNLGIGRIIDRVVFMDGSHKVRKILPLSLSFDHRVVDGAEAARFTNTLIKYLEDPDLFLVES